jgi:predicted ribosome quality control (RQC) complex YloA/Tae2 family protein
MPRDFWLHANDFPGSHVLIRAKRNDEPDANTIEEAALLAIDASGAKEQKAADVVITRQKYLKRVKGHPGQVLVSQKKVRRFIMDQGKLSAIKQRTSTPT